jgi:hypothetical protein
MKIGPVKFVTLFISFSHLFFDLGEIRFKSAVEHLCVSENRVRDDGIFPMAVNETTFTPVP